MSDFILILLTIYVHLCSNGQSRAWKLGCHLPKKIFKYINTSITKKICTAGGNVFGDYHLVSLYEPL